LPFHMECLIVPTTNERLKWCNAMAKESLNPSLREHLPNEIFRRVCMWPANGIRTAKAMFTAIRESGDPLKSLIAAPATRHGLNEDWTKNIRYWTASVELANEYHNSYVT
jgi:hypothetical protein